MITHPLNLCVATISALLFSSIGTLWAATAASVTQSGITWTFDKPYEVGQFANSDWWVLGPVQITAITPEFTGKRNGWQVNPIDTVHQGYDNRAPDFDAKLIPSLPILHGAVSP